MKYKSVILDELNEKGICCTTTRGDSMEPFLSDSRDIVVIRRKNDDEKLRRFDVVLYRRDNTPYYVLHRIYRIRKNDYVICADNRWALEKGVKDQQIVGVLERVRRKGKDLDMNSKLYRLYVLFWYGIYPIRAIFLFGKGVIWNRFVKKTK